MKRANRLMLLFGVILAAVSFVVVLALGSFNQPPQQPPADPDVPVVVAAANLNLGAAITADMLTTLTRKESEAADTYQHPEELIGQVVRRAITQGQALTPDDFQTAVSVPELVRSLQPGLRAIAVPLSKVDAVGALLQPGDFVDVILSMTDVDGLNPVVGENPGYNPTVGNSVPYLPLDEYLNNTSVKAIVQNVQVLASLPRAPSDPSNVIGGTTVVEPDVVVILAVQLQQVEAIRFAQLDGHVSLVMRSPADVATGPVDTTGITLRELVDRWGVLPPLPVTP